MCLKYSVLLVYPMKPLDQPLTLKPGQISTLTNNTLLREQ